MGVLSTHRRMMVIDGLNAVSMMHAGRLGVAIAYLLRATFDAANQGFADAQVLDTDAEGVQDGQLTVVEVDGTLAIVSNECAFTAQSTPSWGGLGFYSQALTRALGYTLLGTINLTTWEEMGVGWHTAGAVVDPDSAEHAIQAHATDGQLDHGGGSAIATGLNTSTDYPLALVLGGYDSNGVPYHDGASGTFTYGASPFIEISGTWTLLWRDKAGNTATLYALLSVLDGAGTLDNFRVPDADLSAVLEPLVKDTFTDDNGTSLDAHTPEVGGGWTERLGDWDIQGNEANPTGAQPAAPRWMATIDSGVADIVTVCDVTPVVGGAPGVIIRYADNNNLWWVQAQDAIDLWRLLERNGAVNTVRAEAAVAIVGGTTYRGVVVTDGQEITAFLDGGNRITYGSAALNETATIHGIRAFEAGDKSDNFHVHARTAAVYDTTLDLY